MIDLPDTRGTPERDPASRAPAPRSRRLLVFACLVLLGAGGCAAMPLWRSSAQRRVPDRLVAAALGDAWRVPAGGTEKAAIPDPPEPANLRPCCAFGADLRVHLGFVVVPGFSLDNMRGLEDVGPHRYNIAPLEWSSSQDPGALSSENNGLLHSCRGGFLDLAHVRDCADLTIFLSAAIERRLEGGGVIELADQGGRRRLVIRAVDGDRIAGAARRRLAVALGQWAAFQVSTWHEIATWYGYSAMSTWPEKMSSFTPEDLYSNMLGIQLAAGILLARDGSSDTDYNDAMNAWLTVAFRRLQVTDKAAASAAIHAVDGKWWDSGRRVPDWQLVTRRNFETGTSLKPWIVPMAFAPQAGPDVGCAQAGPPLRLRNPSGYEGVRFDQDVTLEVDVADAVAETGLPFPRAGSRRLTQADFPALIGRIRQENRAEFGPGHDRPGG